MGRNPLAILPMDQSISLVTKSALGGLTSKSSEYPSTLCRSNWGIISSVQHFVSRICCDLWSCVQQCLPVHTRPFAPIMSPSNCSLPMQCMTSQWAPVYWKSSTTAHQAPQAPLATLFCPRNFSDGLTAFSNQMIKPYQYWGGKYLVRKDTVPVPHSKFLAISTSTRQYKNSRQPRLSESQCIWCIVFRVTTPCSQSAVQTVSRNWPGEQNCKLCGLRLREGLVTIAFECATAHRVCWSFREVPGWNSTPMSI